MRKASGTSSSASMRPVRVTVVAPSRSAITVVRTCRGAAAGASASCLQAASSGRSTSIDAIPNRPKLPLCITQLPILQSTIAVHMHYVAFAYMQTTRRVRPRRLQPVSCCAARSSDAGACVIALSKRTIRRL